MKKANGCFGYGVLVGFAMFPGHSLAFVPLCPPHAYVAFSVRRWQQKQHGLRLATKEKQEKEKQALGLTNRGAACCSGIPFVF